MAAAWFPNHIISGTKSDHRQTHSSSSLSPTSFYPPPPHCHDLIWFSSCIIGMFGKCIRKNRHLSVIIICPWCRHKGRSIWYTNKWLTRIHKAGDNELWNMVFKASQCDFSKSLSHFIWWELFYLADKVPPLLLLLLHANKRLQLPKTTMVPMVMVLHYASLNGFQLPLLLNICCHSLHYFHGLRLIPK